ncbi:hypothetical protein DL89DRAFT_268320 [Linderina pennispora]|uniref:Uncharacterized protein n=1 Tax=Linderina pennispora TaxID=61395 RepID=A0A1Y1W507_9FUNG|nr:uncharacterized protein DL89DRAFT_268320 [Linderina pennispora]KAJ1956814.1 hypothetical protein EC988_001153 [Linderina pennispora]ORX68482.1 hypothetical protein DL89DRAFT_268320 [Linderina pennispora]
MKSFAVVALAAAAVVAANGAQPAPDHQKVYSTILGPQYYQNAAPVVVAASTVVQNAGSDEVTVTSTVTNGATANALSLGSALLAGSLLFYM